MSEKSHGVACPPPSVHPHESNQQSGLDPFEGDRQEDGLADIRFRHSGWRADRARVLQALVQAHVHENRILAFESCGHGAFVMRSTEDPDRYVVRGANCCDRFCKPCARQRAGIVSRNLLEQVQDRRIRFVTLTLRTKSDQLSAELDRLYTSFAMLRRRDAWKKRVTGGAALLEVKWNPGSGRWHPHLHILIEGTYFPQQLLRENWLEITGDSYIVDVRAVSDNKNVVRYITKYATDPVDGSINKNPALLAEAIRAFRGRRTCLTFGEWRGYPLTKQEDDGGWEIVSTLAEAIWHANHGHGQDRDIAREILAGLWVYNTSDSKGGANDPPERSPPDPTLFDVPF